MKIEFGYRNEMTAERQVGDGYVVVRWPFLGAKMLEFDGEYLPMEWLYLDASGPPGSPIYLLEFRAGDDGVPRPGTVMICAQEGGREVRASDLRRLRPLEQILEESVDLIARGPRVSGDDDGLISPAELAARAGLRRAVRGVRRADRRVFTDERAAEVADVYVANMAGGSPTKAVREHFGIAESTASLYVKRARPLIDKKLKERRRGKRQ